LKKSFGGGGGGAIAELDVLTLCPVSSVTFPFIRSNGIEFYFFRIRSRHGTEMATALRNGSADTDCRNGNGYG